MNNFLKIKNKKERNHITLFLGLYIIFDKELLDLEYHH
ncbi:hypothetical protein HMPREF1118_1301 [Haemophilus parainfluenzae HK262]|nr:hypothetical protein HMPREF1118_1301 [Haemophilus parainfluenzae HK262]